MTVIVLSHGFGVVSYAAINKQNTYTYETALNNHFKNEELSYMPSLGEELVSLSGE